MRQLHLKHEVSICLICNLILESNYSDAVMHFICITLMATSDNYIQIGFELYALILIQLCLPMSGLGYETLKSRIKKITI